MTIFVTWQLRVTLDSICNSCAVSVRDVLRKIFQNMVIKRQQNYASFYVSTFFSFVVACPLPRATLAARLGWRNMRPSFIFLFSLTTLYSKFYIFGVKKFNWYCYQLVTKKLWSLPMLERKMWVKNAQSCYLACLALSQRPLFLRKGGDKLFSRRRTQLCDNLLRNSWRPFRPSQ